MRAAPFWSDLATEDKVYLVLVGAWDDFETSVRSVGGMNGDVCSDVFDLADVIVGRSVQMGGEATTSGKLVVDLVFEKEHILMRSARACHEEARKSFLT